MTFLCGQRGFFAFDQSIIFDGSYRIASGQIPFKDFLIPFGPLVFWLHGVVFKLFGVSYASYIFGAAAVNLLATLVSYLILRLLFPGQKLPAYLGSFLTATWFYPPFGTPWPEQTAFFFALITLLSVLGGYRLRGRTTRGARLCYLLAGMAAFAAILSKQNAGALIVPVVAVLFLVENRNALRRGITDFLVFSLGWGLGLLAFGAWLAARSDPGLFRRYFIELPAAEVAAERLPAGLAGWLQTVFIGSGPAVITGLSLLACAVALASLYTQFAGKAQGIARPKTRVWAAVLAPSLFIYHNLFLTTSNNQVENSLPFIGLIAAIGLGLLLPSAQNAAPKPLPRVVLGLSVVILSIGSIWLGANVAYSRQVHTIFKRSTFHSSPATGELSAIKWGDPTRVGNLIPAEDIDQLVEYLRETGENFFIFPDFTVFYGVLGAPSPQPLLWFHNGLTYPNEYDPALDQWIVSDLQKNQVRIVVLEEESWFHTDERLEDFPLLESFITQTFVKQESIGNFTIYVREDH